MQIDCACVLSHLCRVWHFATPWTIACQAPLSVGFSRQEYWSGLPCSPPGDLPDPGVEPVSPASPALQVNSLTTEPLEKPKSGSQLKSPPLVITNIQFPNNPLILNAFSRKQGGGQSCFLPENTVLIFPHLDMQDFSHLDIFLDYLSWTWLRKKPLSLLSGGITLWWGKDFVDELRDAFIHSPIIYSL